jgi:hypothetical protein
LEVAKVLKWGVKTGFIFALQFFMLISDGLGAVALDYIPVKKYFRYLIFKSL